MAKQTENMKEKKNSKVMSFFIFIFLLLALITSLFAIYEIFLLSSIENLIRYIIISCLGIIDLFFILKAKKYKKWKKKKKPKKGLFLFVLFIYSLLCFAIGGFIFYLYGQIDSLNKDSITYTSDLIVLSKNEANSIEDIKNMKIGILTDKKSPEGYIIPKEVINKYKLEDDNEIKEYDDYTTMLVGLYEEELDAMFVRDNYVTMFSGITGYENIEHETK